MCDSGININSCDRQHFLQLMKLKNCKEYNLSVKIAKKIIQSLLCLIHDHFGKDQGIITNRPE